VVLLEWNRVQLRLRRLVHAGRSRGEEAFWNYRQQDPKAPEREGHSVFYTDANGAVFHTYSCYDRGNDVLSLHYHDLDIVPKGRDEGGRGPYWVRRHDEYGS
jgi:predicted dithiol-disulfide oxidoreductase (DUF899 family)